MEQEEQRPLDHYDLVSILYLAQQNRTEQILTRYVPQEILNEGSEGEKVVRFASPVGAYRVDFFFQRISNDVPREAPPGGNVSTSTMHQVVRRLFAGHNPELTTAELTDRGTSYHPGRALPGLYPGPDLNDNYIELAIKH